MSAYNTINHAIANDRVNTASVRGVLFTTVDDVVEAEDTILSRVGSNSNTGMSNSCITFLTSSVGYIVNWSGCFAASDFAGVGVLYSCIEMVSCSSWEAKPIATWGNTLETWMSVVGSGIMKGADVDIVDKAMDEMSDKIAVPVKVPVVCIGVAAVAIGVTDTAVDGEWVPRTCNGYFTTSVAIGIGR